MPPKVKPEPKKNRNLTSQHPWQIPTHTSHVSTFSAINNLSQQTEQNLICKRSQPRVGEKVYQCSELVKLFNTSQAKIKRKNHPKKGKNKIKHDQTEAATKQIYVFGLRKK